jgi:hypothetical protein
MKKWLIAALVVLILLIVSAYVFIPSVIEISRTVVTAGNTSAVYRKLNDEKTWARVIDSANVSGENINYDGFSFKINKGIFDDISIQLLHGSDTINTLFKCLYIKLDSTGFKWTTQITTSSNPLRRIQQFFIANKVPALFDDVLNRLQSYTSVQENIYGNTITMQKVTDTSLMTTKAIYKKYPSDSEVYALLQKVHDAIAGKVKETNPPMMHVQALSDSSYELMVAIPVERGLNDIGDIRFKQMIPGRILVSEIHGGHKTVEQAFKMMDLYLIDHRYNQPAIPFASLVTNRLNEPDTGKWITKIYYPVY